MHYQNPVYPKEFADPFVLKTARGYFAYGTAPPGNDGRIFPVLHSQNLVNWRFLGGALAPLANPPGRLYWAPEVMEKDGRYYLFFSASTTESDDSHRLRVAVADDPAGPFVDSGRLLLPDAGFTIDASPFRDPPTGQFYLYFATDYQTDEPYGTGLAVVRLASDLLSTDGAPVQVVRATADWQIYERNRVYKGRIWSKWHCVEGPHCVFHGGKYFCFYSGGAWQSDNYGVSVAVADHPLGPWHDQSHQGPSVLSGIPDRVLGPGHNSCVAGPDGNTLYMVYHAWNSHKTARRMCIDPVLWTECGPKVNGPSTDPRPLL
jgi:GH43 family beta-xylosidase